MRSNEERIAVLEEQNRTTKDELESLDEKLTAIAENISEMKTALSRQRGFWAGVTFVASIVGFLLKEAWSYLQKATS